MDQADRGRAGLIDSVDPRPLVPLALRLARGTGAEGADLHRAPWAEVFRLAGAERLAPLAWHSSSDAIRAHAPSEVVLAWRRTAHATRALAERHLRTLAGLIDDFREIGIEPIVLKGLPLEWRLYATIGVRPTTDIDLFIPLDQRDDAASLLESLGWIRFQGRFPDDESFRRHDGAQVIYLDLHSRWMSRRQNADAPGEPSWSPVRVEDLDLRAESGPLVPALLAAHLAKHNFPPLLWLHDFAMLWFGDEEGERRAALEAAHRVGLHGYLEWGIARSEILQAAAAGDPRAVEMLGFGPHGRVDHSPRFRDLQLARGLRARAAVLADWLIPVEDRNDPALVARRWVRRLRRLPHYLREHRAGWGPSSPETRTMR